MKKILIILWSLWTLSAYAQQEETLKYHRSSLYSILITHPSEEFHQEISNVFYSIPVPDKFNNHDLSVKVVSSNESKQEKLDEIDAFIVKNAVARRMIGKWFNRDPEFGYFDMKLIAERGNYDASYFDVELAKKTARGTAQLADAGEELIGNTFLIVNDIKYVDKSKGAQTAGTILKVLGDVAGAVTGSSAISAAGNLLGAMVETIKGFTVTVTSYLYRLEWNEEVAANLYNSYYTTEKKFDKQKKAAFDNDLQLFQLKYVGKQSINSGNTSFMGINLDEPEQMIRKVCTRAIDKSIVQLQQNYEEFRVKTPIYAIDGTTIKAKIGLKEGISKDSKFEVLEQTVDKEGRTQYKRVGIIKPVEGKIWDNQYMAVEEKAINATLSSTEFVKVSGGEFYVGMLIREIR
jgi:hypothetical protein